MKSSEMNCPARDVASRFAVGGPFARSLRSAASAALTGLAFLSASTSALAGVPGLNVTVTSLAPLDPATNTRPITYSVTGGATYQTAYSVSMTATSPVNAVYFYAFTAATNGLTPKFTTPVADLRSGDSCTAPALPGGTELDCAIGPIAPGSTVTFTLLIPSPVAPVSGADSLLSVTWAVQAGQGQPNPSNLVHQGSQDVTLQVGSPKGGVKSFVLAGDALGVTDGGSNTNVTPPIPVTVGVKQDINPNSCAAHFKNCFTSTITIVDGNNVLVQFPSTDPLEIDLLRAASSLKKNARFANAQLFYTNDSGQTFTIPTCDGSSGQLTTGAKRCITPAVSGAVVGQTGVDASGNWLFHILAGENGIINW